MVQGHVSTLVSAWSTPPVGVGPRDGAMGQPNLVESYPRERREGTTYPSSRDGRLTTSTGLPKSVEKSPRERSEATQRPSSRNGRLTTSMGQPILVESAKSTLQDHPGGSQYTQRLKERRWGRS